MEDVLIMVADATDSALPEVIRSYLDPWAEARASEILAGRATSAGPTRSGKSVQVRFRIGNSVVASSHPLDNLLDGNMSFVGADLMEKFIGNDIMSTVIREDQADERLRALVEARVNEDRSLLKAYSASANKASQSSSVRSIAYSFQSDVRRIIYDRTRHISPRSRVLVKPGVRAAAAGLVRAAAGLIAGVPHHAFVDSGNRLEHDVAKRKLLKALKAALLAGLTDRELEDLKNEAIVNQIMT